MQEHIAAVYKCLDNNSDSGISNQPVCTPPCDWPHGWFSSLKGTNACCEPTNYYHSNWFSLCIVKKPVEVHGITYPRWIDYHVFHQPDISLIYQWLYPYWYTNFKVITKKNDGAFGKKPTLPPLFITCLHGYKILGRSFSGTLILVAYGLIIIESAPPPHLPKFLYSREKGTIGHQDEPPVHV